jgi:hypothetical protein
MAQVYCSFLIRCWRNGDHEQRVEIEHIQSGERALIGALDAALEWIATRSEAVCPPSSLPMHADAAIDREKPL